MLTEELLISQTGSFKCLQCLRFEFLKLFLPYDMWFRFMNCFLFFFAQKVPEIFHGFSSKHSVRPKKDQTI